MVFATVFMPSVTPVAAVDSNDHTHFSSSAGLRSSNGQTTALGWSQRSVYQDGYMNTYGAANWGAITQCVSAKATWDGGSTSGSVTVKAVPNGTTTQNGCGATWSNIPTGKTVTFEIFAKVTGAEWTGNRVKTSYQTSIPSNAWWTHSIPSTSFYVAHGTW